MRKWSYHMKEKVSVWHISGKPQYLCNSGIHSALLIKFLEGGSHLIGWDSYPMKWGSDHKVKRSHRQLMCTQCLPRRWTKLTSDWSMYSSIVTEKSGCICARLRVCVAESVWGLWKFKYLKTDPEIDQCHSSSGVEKLSIIASNIVQSAVLLTFR